MIRLPNSILCFFNIKKKLDRFCILCAGWTGRKYREISRKIGKNTEISAIFLNSLLRASAPLAIYLRFIGASPILPIFLWYSRGIDNRGEYRIEGDRYPKFRINIGDKFRFFNPCLQYTYHIGEGVHCLNSLLVSLFDFGSPFLSGWHECPTILPLFRLICFN